jgi:chromosome segregation ATPase
MFTTPTRQVSLPSPSQPSISGTSGSSQRGPSCFRRLCHRVTVYLQTAGFISSAAGAITVIAYNRPDWAPFFIIPIAGSFVGRYFTSAYWRLQSINEIAQEVGDDVAVVSATATEVANTAEKAVAAGHAFHDEDEKMRSGIVQLRETTREAAHGASEWQTNLMATRAANQHLAEENRDLRREIDALRGQLSILSTETSSLTRDNRILDTNIAQVGQYVERIDSARREADKTREEFRIDIAAYTRGQVETEAANHHLLQELQKENQLLVQEVSELQKAIEALQATLMEQNAALLAANQPLSLETQLKQLSDLIQRAEALARRAGEASS